MKPVNVIVKNTIKQIVIQTVYLIIVSVLNIIKDVLNTVVTQYASGSEIERLRGETSIIFTELLMRYNNSLHLITNGLMLIVFVYMIYSAYKYVVNTWV